MKKAVLIDGSSLFFRSYYAAPKISLPDGQPIGAVYGFCGMVLSLIKSHIADVITIIFDSGRETFRTQIYDQYKANRSPTPDDMKMQYPIILEACEAFGIKTVSKRGVEADDIIATYSTDLSGKNCAVEIVSPDKDFMQLVSDTVSIFDAMHHKYIGPEQVFEKFGVYPKSMTALQALMGDSVDNVPGVTGVGVKTAAKLIARYESLDNLYENISEITPQKVRENLMRDKDNAFLSLKLVTLAKDVEIEKDYVSLRYNAERIKEFFRKYDFNSLMKRI